jgi:hypothetical protein
LTLLVVLLLLTVLLVGPIDRTPLEHQAFYQDMNKVLDTLSLTSYPSKGRLEIGWSAINITPSTAKPMAGYKRRPFFQSVRDSLYIRIMAISNGSVNVCLISADLLLFPPALKKKVTALVKSSFSHPSFLYFAATHTHNGIGGWHNSVVGSFALGEYDQNWIDTTAAKVVKGLKSAVETRLPADISYFEHDLGKWVENRIAFERGSTDGTLRGFKVKRSDGSKGVFFSFSAHATTISKSNLVLSGDYPGETIKLLHEEYDFAMFMAGMVGSHRFRHMRGSNDQILAREASLLVHAIDSARVYHSLDSATVLARHMQIEFGPSQVRISRDWKLRDWVFRLLVGELEGEMTVVQLGNMTLLATPCDFSGELSIEYNFAKLTNHHLIVTSFNGDYVGYITHDPHYDDLDKEEVRIMNWVGPFYGLYFSHIMTRLLQKI